MSDDYNTKGRILAAMKVAAQQGKHPRRIHIPLEFETEMCLLDRSEVGIELARAILRLGPRKAIEERGNTLFGMEIVWDADEFKIESD